MSQEEVIYICAVRYLIGKRSWMVKVVGDYLRRNKYRLSEEVLETIIKDVSKVMESKKKRLGDKYLDEFEWMKLRDELAKVLKNRNTRVVKKKKEIDERVLSIIKEV